jgi:hypothetical protein
VHPKLDFQYFTKRRKTMPNHVTCELTAPVSVLASLSLGDKKIDFNTVVPMPKILDEHSPDLEVIHWAEIATRGIGEAPKQTDAAQEFRAGDYGAAAQILNYSTKVRSLTQGPYPKDFTNERWEVLLRCMKAIRETGHPSFLGWSNEHWGTKWNAYEIEEKSPTCIRFQTAWSPPIPILVTLSKKFPTELLKFRWSDEDVGNNVGDIQLLAGNISGVPLMNGSLEAFQVAADLGNVLHSEEDDEDEDE